MYLIGVMTIVNQMTEVAPGHFSLFKKQCINSEGENINAYKLKLMFKKLIERISFPTLFIPKN